MRRVFKSTVALTISFGTLIFGLLGAFGQAAVAQELPQVELGQSFTVENSAATPCPGNSDVVARIEAASGASAQVGLGVSTPEGLFSMEATLPPTWEYGDATVVVDCGMTDSVLSYDVVVVAASGTDYLSYAPFVGAGTVALALVGWFISRSAKSEDEEVISNGVDPDAPEAGFAVAPPAGAESNDGQDVYEDDSEYWFWDNMTDRGPVKRIACLSNEGFYLHEVPEDGFARLVEQLAQHGPEVTLAAAFFAVPVDTIDEVHHRGTQLRVSYYRDGEKVAQVIDLGTEVTGVVDLLSRRVPVVAAPTPVPTR